MVGEDVANKPRKVLRVVVIVSLLAAAGFSLLSLHAGFASGPARWLFGGLPAGSTPGTPTIAAGVFGPASPFWPALWLICMAAYLLVGAYSIYASTRYLVDVVRRMPDPVLETRVNQLKRRGPWLATLGILLIGLGPLIAFIESWIIIHNDLAQNQRHRRRTPGCNARGHSLSRLCGPREPKDRITRLPESPACEKPTIRRLGPAGSSARVR